MAGNGKVMALKLRIPGWALSEGVRVVVNGEEWHSCAAAAGHLAGSFCTVQRTFAAGQLLALADLLATNCALPLHVKQHPLDANIGSLRCGLHVWYQGIWCSWSCQCLFVRSGYRTTEPISHPCMYNPCQCSFPHIIACN